MLSEMLKDSSYNLSQFSEEKLKKLESLIFEREVKGKVSPYIKCLKRNKDIKLTPEEIVRL